MMFCILLTPMWILFFGLAIYSGAVYTASEKGLEGFCPNQNGQVNLPDDTFHALFSNYYDDIDGALVPTINKWMCSEQCPCDAAY